MKLTEEQMKTTYPYDLILSRLRSGYYMAVSAKSLCDYTGLNDRAMRKAIEVLRENGVCIVSDAFGYYFPGNEEELERYIKRTEKTARSYFLSLRSAKKALREMQTETQMKLPE